MPHGAVRRAVSWLPDPVALHDFQPPPNSASMGPLNPRRHRHLRPLDTLANSQARHPPPGDQDRSSRCSMSHSNTSLGSEDGWDIDSQMRSLHSYIRFLLTKADFEQCVIKKPTNRRYLSLKMTLGLILRM